MELTKEKQRQIETIKSDMTCPFDFKCQKSGFKSFTKVKQVGNLLECLEDNKQECEFSFSFRIGYLCRCPLNRYIHNFDNKKAILIQVI